MKLDEIDIKLINKLYTLNKKMSTYDLVKEIFSEKKRFELQKLDMMIRKRLQKLKRNNLVKNETHNGRTTYSLIDNSLICAKGSIQTEPKKKSLPTRKFESEDILIFPQKNGIFIYTFIPVRDDYG